MAKEKKERRCKECEGMGKECKCPDKPKKGYYGLEDHDGDDATMDPDMPQTTVGEAIKMPRAPQDSDRDMKGISSQKKKKKMSEFKAAVDDAKRRQGDADRKSELAHERRTKGIRFYDAKGSGYMKGGKKVYD